MDDLARFWRHVDRSGDCWVWTASRYTKGYGMFAGGRAHRFAYERLVGPIPDGMFVLHHCDNPPCIRPDHLFLGTHAANMADRGAKGRVARGSRHGMARLREEDVRAIRLLGRTGVAQQAIADRFGVRRQTVSDVLTGSRWGWLPDQPSRT